MAKKSLFFRAFAAVLTALIISSCSNLLDRVEERSASKTSSSGKNSISFSVDSSLNRTAIADVDFSIYTYSIAGTDSSSSNTFSKSDLSYSALTETSYTVASGAWTFVVTAYSGSTAVLKASASVTVSSDGITIPLSFYACTGGTGGASITLQFATGRVTTAYVKLCDTANEALNTSSDTASEITTGDVYDSVTFTSDDIASGVTKFVRFFLYDDSDTLLSNYTVGVYTAAGLTVTKTYTTTLDGTYTVSVTTILDGDDWDDSTATLTLTNESDSSDTTTLTCATGTNIFYANVASGSYKLSADNVDTGTTIDANNTSAELSFWSVSLPTVTGLVFTSADSYSNPVLDEKEYSFTVQIKSGYRVGSSVTLYQDSSETALTAASTESTSYPSTYTLSAVSAATTITADEDGVVVDPTYELVTPSYTQVASAGVSYGTKYSVALIDLGDGGCPAALEKGATVATGTIGSTNVTALAASTVSKGASQIPVVISGTSFSGEVSLAIESSLDYRSPAVSADDCYDVYTVYYGQDFESVTSYSDVATYSSESGVSSAIMTDSNDNNYFQAYVNNASGGRAVRMPTMSAIPSSGQYVIEFDAGISPSNTANSSAILALTTSTTVATSLDSNYLLRLYYNGTANGSDSATSFTWTVNGSTTTEVSLKSYTFYHYKVVVDITNSVAKATITSSDGTTTYLDKETLTDVTSYKATNLYMLMGKGYRSRLMLDNLAVYTYENISLNPTFTAATKPIDLAATYSDYGITAVTAVSSNAYATGAVASTSSATGDSSTTVTITSAAAGTGYVFATCDATIDGVTYSAESDYGQLTVAIPVTVKERGNLSLGTPVFYGTATSFTQFAEDITGTSSGEGSLDTTEPDDPVDCIVDTDELSALVDYTSEDDVVPQVKVFYNLSDSEWNIWYTSDTTPTATSVYKKAAATYTGLLDAVNAGFSYLSGSKPKLMVCNSGSTGTAAENTSSVVNSSDRMASTHAIKMRAASNRILDFGGNTIWVDTSEADSSGYNISAFIDIERGSSNISVRNLVMTGQPGYGIFMGQASNIVCENIHFAKAVGESIGCGIGIRPQSEATASTNVALSRWSHDLYLNNISANGISEHVVETFNAYNVYMDNITGTDIGGNAVLLNGTYSATIGTIKGTRCCSGGGYAAFRCANDVGPDIKVHYIYSEGCGRGVFFVSSVTGVTIDKVNIINAVQGCLYNSIEFAEIRGGKIQTNGGTVTYFDSSSEENTATYSVKTKTASTGALLMVNGSSSHYLGVYHNSIENVTFTGFTTDVTERPYMAANYNSYSGNTMKAVSYDLSGKSGTNATYSSAPGIYNLVSGVNGGGDNAVSGSAVTENGFTAYQSTKTSGYVITGYSGTGGAITIPSTINSVAVTEIGDFAFYGNTAITSVTIPPSVTLIGDLAFADCTALTTLTINGGGTVEIDAGAFRGCTALTSATLTGVKYLRHAAFANCTALTAVTCPETLVYFGANCFYGDDVAVTIEATDASAVTMEPYAFFFIGRKGSITFTGISASPDLQNLTGSDAKRYYTVDTLEQETYTAGYWDSYWYHVAVPPVFSGSATNRVNINGSYTSLALNTTSSSSYYFAALDGTIDALSLDGGTITAGESFFLRVPLANGNYKVTLTTSADSVISECMTDDVTYYYTNSEGTRLSKTYTPPTDTATDQPLLGITKSITSGSPFEVAVCDGLLDLEFVYGSTAITLSTIKIEKESYAKRTLPYLIAVGDSTLALGDITIKSSDTYCSWGASISNGYVDLPSSLGGFINCGQSGGDSVTIYNDARIEKILLNCHPGDYVSVNIGINQAKSYTIGGVSVDASDSRNATGAVLEKYLIDAVLERGGIPFITTITAQGPDASTETAESNSGVFYYSAYEGTATAYSNSYASSSWFGADYDDAASSSYQYCAGAAYAVGTALPVSTWVNSRRTNPFNILLIDIANYYQCDIVDLGVYGEKYLNEHLNADDDFATVRDSYYTDKHHYRKIWGDILATYMLDCVDKMAKGSYSYPYGDYQPCFVYSAD
mgnify:FL=1